MNLVYIASILVIGTVGSYLLFVKPRFATYLLITLCIFDLGFFTRWLGMPEILRRLPYAIAVILSIKILLHYIKHRDQIRHFKRTVCYVLAFSLSFFIIFIFSNIYNHESLLLGIYELRYYFLFSTLTLGILLYIPVSTSPKYFIKPFIYASLVQLPVTIAQYFTIQILGIRLSYSALDMVSGTFANYSQLILLQSITIGLILSYQLSIRKKIIGVNNYLLILLVLVPLLLSFSRSAIVFVLLGIYMSLLINTLRQRRVTIFVRNTALMVLLPLVSVSLFYFVFWKQHDFSGQLNTEYISHYFLRDPLLKHNPVALAEDPRMGRARAVVESVKIVTQDPVTSFFGLGLGAVSTARFLNVEGHYYEVFGPLAGIGRSQFSKTMAETGGAGIFFVACYLFIMLKSAKKAAMRQYPYCFDVWAIISVISVPIALYAKFFEANVTLLIFAYSTVFLQQSLTTVKLPSMLKVGRIIS